MANMSYCRFRNTLADLRDCADNMEGELSREEGRARRDLVRLCYEIAQNYGETFEDAA